MSWLFFYSFNLLWLEILNTVCGVVEGVEDAVVVVPVPCVVVVFVVVVVVIVCLVVVTPEHKSLSLSITETENKFELNQFKLSIQLSWFAR